jgi:hypothetical protein
VHERISAERRDSCGIRQLLLESVELRLLHRVGFVMDTRAQQPRTRPGIENVSLDQEVFERASGRGARNIRRAVAHAAFRCAASGRL